MEAVRTVAPSREEILALITLDEFKANKRIAHSMEDPVVEDCIVDAYGYFDGPEGWLRRPVLPQTWEIFLDALGDANELPISPLIEITSVETRGLTGTWSAVDDASYELLAPGSTYSRLGLVPGSAWPALPLARRGVRITAVGGWAVDDVPSGIRRAVMLLAGSLYEHREADFEDTRVTTVSRKIEFGILQFAGRYRVLNDPAGYLR